MRSHHPLAPALLALALALAPGAPVRAAQPPRRELRVCADPNNLPFSNDKRQGFENQLASLIARELRAELSYVWWPQHRGFSKRTLRAHLCDVVMGLPTGFERVLTTQPVYRSGYVFISRPSTPAIHSLDAPELRRLDSPSADLIRAVARDEIDVASPGAARRLFRPTRHATAARGASAIRRSTGGYAVHIRDLPGGAQRRSSPARRAEHGAHASPRGGTCVARAFPLSALVMKF